jgi:hypothetical protein
MPQIILNIDEQQLEDMVARLKKIEPYYEVKNPLRLLELMLKVELSSGGYAMFLDNFIDGGGNELIGDCLEEKDCEGIVIDTRNDESSDDSSES